MNPDRFDHLLDEPTRRRLAEIQDGYLRISHRLLGATLFQALVLLAVAASFSYLAHQNSTRIAENHRVLAANVRLTEQIQTERRRNTRTNCEDTNARHDGTIRRLRALAAANKRAGYRARRGALRSTISLIDALVPRRDCEKLVDESIRGG